MVTAVMEQHGGIQPQVPSGRPGPGRGFDLTTVGHLGQVLQRIIQGGPQRRGYHRQVASFVQQVSRPAQPRPVHTQATPLDADAG